MVTNGSATSIRSLLAHQRTRAKFRYAVCYALIPGYLNRANNEPIANKMHKLNTETSGINKVLMKRNFDIVSLFRGRYELEW